MGTSPSIRNPAMTVTIMTVSNNPVGTSRRKHKFSLICLGILGSMGFSIQVLVSCERCQMGVKRGWSARIFLYQTMSISLSVLTGRRRGRPCSS
jgi:hypothetical protein